MKFLNIGVITKTQGLKGEVRAKILQNQNDLIKNNSFVYLNNEKFLVNKITNRNTFVVLKLNEINSIEEVEHLINSDIYIEKTNTALSDDEFLIDDVIGFDVVDENNNKLGNIAEIANYGAGDVYSVSNKTNNFLFVNSRNIITNFDFANKKIVINSKILDEIGVFY